MLQIVSDVNLMRSMRSCVRVFDMCDVFLLMRFREGNLDREETCFLLLLFFFVDAEKNLGISRFCVMCDMMRYLLINKNSAISEKILHLSFSLSLSLLII